MAGLRTAPEIAIAVPRVMPSRRAPKKLVGTNPTKGVTAGQRRHDERLSLALLPGEVLRGEDVEGGVDEVVFSIFGRSFERVGIIRLLSR